MNKNYNNLGFNSLYYFEDKKGINLYNSFQEAIRLSEKRIIDVPSVLEFINFFYFLSDRTLIKGLNKSPWLAKLSSERTSWDYYSLRDEYVNINSEMEYAEIFIRKLENEISSYIEGKKHVGILLTGGMDSRVIAVVLNKLLLKFNDKVNVTAFTWGMENSRDVIYSNKIASRYGWNFKHIELNSDTLKRNILLTASKGCEFSPVHLHGMQSIRDVEKIEVMLAGSYGDSMGRGEYSGVHVSNLVSIEKKITNRFNLLNYRAYKENVCYVKEDLSHYRKLFPRKKAYSNYEVEMLAHYMRRELNPCMSLINDKIPLYQCFATPEIFEFVLNTPLEYRNDNTYYNILMMLDKDILEIPWARTGRPYLDTKSESDKYSKNYHKYGEWIKQDLFEYIENTIMDGNLSSLGIFNMKSLRNIIKLNKQFGGERVNRIDEILVWLASLSIMMKKYDIGTSNQTYSDDVIKYNMIALNSYLYTILYLTLAKLKR